MSDVSPQPLSLPADELKASLGSAFDLALITDDIWEMLAHGNYREALTAFVERLEPEGDDSHYMLALIMLANSLHQVAPAGGPEVA
jgi:hypothetical protein